MLKFFQKYIVSRYSAIHRDIVLLNQKKDGHTAICKSEIAQSLLRADHNPWKLSWSDIRDFKEEALNVYIEATKIRLDRETAQLKYHQQIYQDIYLTFSKVPGLKLEWDEFEERAEFSIGGVQLTCGRDEHDVLYCISIIESLAKAEENFNNEVAERAKKGVVSPSTQGCMAIEQTSNANKARLYALIGYGADGQPL